MFPSRGFRLRRKPDLEATPGTEWSHVVPLARLATGPHPPRRPRARRSRQPHRHTREREAAREGDEAWTVSWAG